MTPSRGERVPAADVGLTAGASAAEATPARRATETTEAMRIATALAPKAAMASTTVSASDGGWAERGVDVYRGGGRGRSRAAVRDSW